MAKDEDIQVSFANKHIKGGWNGAGMHTHFSTANIGDKTKDMGAIENAIAALGNNHQDHIGIYGAGLAERLTGHHETCSINQFQLVPTQTHMRVASHFKPPFLTVSI